MADEAAAGENAAPRGILAVTAPVLFGCTFVMPSMVEYLERYPDMSTTALRVDRVVKLLDEGQDVGVQIGELPDSTAIAIGVGHVRRVVCGSPAYLRAYGVPRAPADLAQHTMICASQVSPSFVWNFLSGKKAINIKVIPRLAVTNNVAAIAASVQGFRVTRLLSYQVAAHVAAGRLKTAMREYEPPQLPIHVLHREGRQASARTTTFVNLLVERLRANKALR